MPTHFSSGRARNVKSDLKASDSGARNKKSKGETMLNIEWESQKEEEENKTPKKICWGDYITPKDNLV